MQDCIVAIYLKYNDKNIKTNLNTAFYISLYKLT